MINLAYLVEPNIEHLIQPPQNESRLPDVDDRLTYKVEYKSNTQNSTMTKTTIYYKFEFISVTGGAQTILNEFERRYSHFSWLQKSLQKEYLGVIIPSIPQQQIQFDADRRKSGLIDFIQKVIDHPLLFKSISTQKFLNEKKIEIFEGYVENHQVSIDSTLNTIVSTMTSAFGSVKGIFVGNGGFQPRPRVPTDDVKYDERIESYQLQDERNLRLETEILQVLCNKIERIVSNLHAKLDSLKGSQAFFKIDSQDNIEFKVLDSICIQYNKCYHRINEQILFKLEQKNLIRDLSSAISILQLRKEKKDQLNLDQQRVLHQNFADQKSLISGMIHKTQADIAQLEQEFDKDFVDIFCLNTRKRINDLVFQLDRDLAEFYGNVYKIGEDQQEQQRQDQLKQDLLMQEQQKLEQVENQVLQPYQQEPGQVQFQQQSEQQI